MATIGHIVAAKAAEQQLPSPLPAVRVVDLLNNGGVAVIVGVKGDNVTDAMRRHAQIHCWDTTDPKTHGKSLPANTRAVMITRFVTHSLERRIRDEAKRRKIFIMPGLVTTGDVRDQLQLVVDRPSFVPAPAPVVAPVIVKPVAVVVELAPEPVQAKPDITPVPPVENEKPAVIKPPLREPGHGEIRKLVLEHADRRVVAVAPNDESLRLWRMIRDLGINSSKSSVRGAVSKYIQHPEKYNKARIRRFLPVGDKTVVKAVATVEPDIVSPVVERKPKVAPQLHSAGQTDSLLTAMDEAMKYVGEVKAAMGLLDELLPSLRKEIERFREQQRRARELFQLD